MSESFKVLGRPVQKISPPTPEKTIEHNRQDIENSEEKAVEKTVDSQAPGSGRGGDNTLGRPIQKPNISQTSIVSRVDLEEKAAPADIEDSFVQPITLPLAWLSGVWLVLLLLGGIIGWFVFSQVLSTVNMILQFPLVIQSIAWCFVVFFTFIVIYPLSRLLLAYRRLKPIKQISMTRISTKNLSAEKWQEAKETISSYLQNYPLDDRKCSEQLEKIGLSEIQQRKLQDTKLRLLEKSPITTEDWISEFEQDFLMPLDGVVKARIQHYAKLLALKAALSPHALIDMAVVFYNGFSLLRDICTLYQVRIGRLGILYLLGLVIFQSYVAGQIEHHIDGVEHWMEDWLQGSVLGATGAKLASLAGSKVSEAAIHFFFLRRIGHSMMARLRPLEMQKH